MSTALERFNKIKDQTERLQREADRATGAFDQLLGRLKSEFDCETIEEAEEKLTDMNQRLKTTEREFNEKLTEFETKHADVLGDSDE